MDHEEFRERAYAWVERTTKEQGVPLKLTTPQLVQRVAQILADNYGRRHQA
jgi:hypothetical protein